MAEQCITVPEGHVALVLPKPLAIELRSVLRLVRENKLPYMLEPERVTARAIVADVLLAMLDDRSWDDIETREALTRGQ